MAGEQPAYKQKQEKAAQERQKTQEHQDNINIIAALDRVANEIQTSRNEQDRLPAMSKNPVSARTTRASAWGYPIAAQTARALTARLLAHLTPPAIWDWSRRLLVAFAP